MNSELYGWDGTFTPLQVTFNDLVYKLGISVSAF